MAPDRSSPPHNGRDSGQVWSPGGSYLSPVARRLRQVRPGWRAALGIALAAQLALTAQNVVPTAVGWWNSLASAVDDGRGGEYYDDDLGHLLAWADEQMAPGASVLVVTGGPRPNGSFIRASYALYPRTVYPWLPPRGVPFLDWDMLGPMRSGALARAAAEQGARYLLVDGFSIEDVARPDGSRIAVYDAEREQYLVALP